MVRDISIAAVLNGWVVKVGCQTLVYSDKALLLSNLSDYLSAPEETEKRIVDSSVNARHTLSLTAPNTGADVGSPRQCEVGPAVVNSSALRPTTLR